MEEAVFVLWSFVGEVATILGAELGDLSPLVAVGVVVVVVAVGGGDGGSDGASRTRLSCLRASLCCSSPWVL